MRAYKLWSDLPDDIRPTEYLIHCMYQLLLTNLNSLNWQTVLPFTTYVFHTKLVGKHLHCHFNFPLDLSYIFFIKTPKMLWSCSGHYIGCDIVDSKSKLNSTWFFDQVSPTALQMLAWVELDGRVGEQMDGQWMLIDIVMYIWMVLYIYISSTLGPRHYYWRCVVFLIVQPLTVSVSSGSPPNPYSSIHHHCALLMQSCTRCWVRQTVCQQCYWPAVLRVCFQGFAKPRLARNLRVSTPTPAFNSRSC